MTDKELCEQYGVELCLFDASDWHSSGFYNHDTKVIGIDKNLDPSYRRQVLLHELGHIQHCSYSYQFNPIKYENQANRNMIHHLVKDAISQLNDVKDFNYLKFMEYYNLNTTTDEIMIKEEFHGLVSGL
ncbi:ImmA/IrrE family metallo-endopeptidase [Streptococcus merionis]|uniref:ImmA/IrrE family metallo-endopeptidase n=1 Tax=Streptococcus merionis TaxID=400065 RepID=UPI003517C8CA